MVPHTKVKSKGESALSRLAISWYDIHVNLGDVMMSEQTYI